MPVNLISRMSQLGQNRKSSVGLGMSVAGGKADEISTITDIASQAGGGVSHWSALIAATPQVSSSWASVNARFGNSGTATSPSGPATGARAKDG